jgi:hypothetical protein
MSASDQAEQVQWTAFDNGLAERLIGSIRRSPCQSWVGFTIGTFESEYPTDAMGQAVKAWHPSGPLRHGTKGVCPMSHRNNQSKNSSTAFDQASTLVAVVELSRDFWLVAGVVPGIERHPLKKFAADENRLLRAAVLARYGDACRVDDIDLDASRTQPRREPEAVSALPLEHLVGRARPSSITN